MVILTVEHIKKAYFSVFRYVDTLLGQEKFFNVQMTVMTPEEHTSR
jgi:hypothetical protein